MDKKSLAKSFINRVALHEYFVHKVIVSKNVKRRENVWKSQNLKSHRESLIRFGASFLHFKKKPWAHFHCTLWNICIIFSQVGTVITFKSKSDINWV